MSDIEVSEKPTAESDGTIREDELPLKKRLGRTVRQTAIKKKIEKLLRYGGLSNGDKLDIINKEINSIARNAKPISPIEIQDTLLNTLVAPPAWKCKDGEIYQEKQLDGSYILYKCRRGQMVLLGPA